MNTLKSSLNTENERNGEYLHEKGNETVNITIENKCMFCGRTFKTCKGLLLHIHGCKQKHQENTKQNVTSDTQETKPNSDTDVIILNDIF